MSTEPISVQLVKITVNEDGEKERRGWCLTTSFADAQRTVCMGEAVGEGESSAVYTEKTGVIADVTCEKCKEIIRWWKRRLVPKRKLQPEQP